MLLDARPDRIDFRDREYRPRLVSQPAQYPSPEEIGVFFERYVATDRIQDQGSEGACTGFGLAAVVNYLNWIKALGAAATAGQDIAKTPLEDPPPLVSPWMLYNVARIYDEWEGEDYSGSSCRGAMKGWHKHGVCQETMWPKRAKVAGKRPDAGWQQDAAKIPLGSYYRVNTLSISDMQSAIYEVGAVFCSAKVHTGWQFDGLTEAPETQAYPIKTEGGEKVLSLPIIKLSTNEVGGHAFAVVGYNDRGFIIQNSWGPKWATTWGKNNTDIPHAAGGFALMTYEDWVINSRDAWVAALAAPMRTSKARVTTTSRSRHSLLEQSAQIDAQLMMSSPGKTIPPHWDEQKAYDHSIVMGNDGKLIRRRIDAANAKSDLQQTIGNILKGCNNKDVVIFAHGGLNSEEAAIRHAQNLGPWFEANGIVPIFVIWRTGFVDAVANIGQDMVADFQKEMERVENNSILGLIEKARDKLEKKFDLAFEAIAEKVLGKAVWSQIKQNAQAACQRNSATGMTGGMRLLADQIKKSLKGMETPCRIHLLGHSAGAIILGHFASDLARFTKIGSIGLFAPACTLKFANATFRPLVEKDKLPAKKFYVFNLNRKNERSDKVGPYNKSLLYLVSRAFESPRKAPLLGLDDAWILESDMVDGENSFPSISRKAVADRATHEKSVFDQLGKFYAQQDLRDVVEWREFKAQSKFTYMIHQGEYALVKEENGQRSYEPIAHGSLDNDITFMNTAINLMIGSTPEPVTDLSGS